MDYKKEFIKFMADSGALIFGDFTAKSGRKTPYFVNAGNYRTGRQIAALGEFYAGCIMGNGLAGKFDALFGPAYKAIPLCVETASALSRSHGIETSYCFNRKEAKDHGEGGVIVGYQPKDGDRILITEDVMTAGTSIRETLPVLRAAADVEIAGIVISVDRMERGTGEMSAVQEVRRSLGIPVYPIITVLDIIAALEDGTIAGREYVGAMRGYRKEYGVND